MTLAMAIQHKDALNQAFAAHAHDLRWRWYHGAYSLLEKDLVKDTWGKVQMVSVVRPRPRISDIPSLPPPVRLLGYISATLSRERRLVDALAVVRFGTRPSFEFGRDMARFMCLLFDHYAVFAVQWTVVVGSPHERTYDLLAARLAGRVVGTLKGDAVLHDGTRHDRKLYEVLAENLNRRALDRLAGVRDGRQDEALARGGRTARPQPGDAEASARRDRGAGQGSSPDGSSPLRPRERQADGGVGGIGGSDDDPVMRHLGNFGARVTGSGGGKVELLVDRDTLFYPAVGTHVEVLAGDPRVRLDAPRFGS